MVIKDWIMEGFGWVKDWIAYKKQQRELAHIERIINYGKVKKAEREREKKEKDNG